MIQTKFESESESEEEEEIIFHTLPSKKKSVYFPMKVQQRLPLKYNTITLLNSDCTEVSIDITAIFRFKMSNGSKSKSTTSSTLTPEQRKRMEFNRSQALKKLKRKRDEKNLKTKKTNKQISSDFQLAKRIRDEEYGVKTRNPRKKYKPRFYTVNPESFNCARKWNDNSNLVNTSTNYFEYNYI